MDLTKYDVIGDIHGHASVLRNLLVKLGYREDGGVFRHPDRRVIFVGDFIDRGPEQIDVLNIARNMCEAGTALAVMGNHEFNALGWATPDGIGGFLRPHNAQNHGQHKEFLLQVGHESERHIDALAWFQKLQVWLDLPGLRVVHACWHGPSQQKLLPHLDEGHRFTKHGLCAASKKGSDAYNAAEILLKGPEAILPDGRSFKDKQGDVRHEVRLRWWDPDATSFRIAALGMDGDEETLPDLPVTTEYQYRDTIPVFFGHYWLKGTPIIPGSNTACLDFSVAKEGFLTAYRWSGESVLSQKNLVYVKA